jgi:hypothetical protein
MTQPDIYTVEARRRLAAPRFEDSPTYAACILDGSALQLEAPVLAAALRELNWQPPVDPDLLEARKVVAAVHDDPSYVNFARRVLDGEEDDCTDVKCALAAIKRGRELERGE